MKNKTWIWLAIIFLFGAVLRLYQVNRVPPGFTWDEAAIGYNAYSLMITGKDEYGRAWPLILRSFEDYKSGVLSILLVPIFKSFGMSIIVMRVFSGLIGSLLILAGYFLTKKWFGKTSLALLVAGLIAISPWAVHTSRFVIEWYLGLVLVLFGLGFLIESVEKPKKLLPAAGLLGFSLYFYQNLKLLIPLMLVTFFITYFKEIVVKQWKLLLMAGLLGLLTISPLLVAISQNSDWMARAQRVSLLNDEGLKDNFNKNMYTHVVSGWPLVRLFNNKPVFYGLEMTKKYLGHFDANFLLFGQDATPRISVDKVGKIYLISVPFLLYGLLTLINQKKKRNWLLLIWLMLAPIPAALTNDSPHGLRSIMMLPLLAMITALGMQQAVINIKLKGLKVSLIGLMIVVHGLGLGYFFWRYLLFYSTPNAKLWQAGYETMVNQLKSQEDQFDQVIVSTHLGQPQIFIAFFTPIDPKVFQEEALSQNQIFNSQFDHLGKIRFKQIEKSDYCQPNTLVVTEDGKNESEFIFVNTNDLKVKLKYCQATQ